MPQIDPTSATVTLTLRTETPTKHDWALSRVGTPAPMTDSTTPPPFSMEPPTLLTLVSTSEDRALISVRAPTTPLLAYTVFFVGDTDDFNAAIPMTPRLVDAPGTVFSSIDHHGRYAYANQPEILSWNLARLAETLIPFVDPDKDRAIELLTETIECIQPLYESHWLAGMRSKIGLSTEDPLDLELINDLLSVMEEGHADFTLVFRRLSQALRGGSNAVRHLFEEPGDFDVWAQRWQKRLEQDGIAAETGAQAMDRVNPIYIPRNHKVEEALAAAVDREDMMPFSKLLAVLSHPFDEVAGNEAYATPAPVTNIPYQTFCGT